MIGAAFLQWLYFCVIVLAFLAIAVVVMVVIWGLVIACAFVLRLIHPRESS